MKKLLALLATVALTATTYAGEFPDISITELKAAIESKKAVVVDVNGAASYKAGHIPTAIAFDAKSFAKSLPKEKDALIVAYCGGPTCNAYSKAAKEAQKLGYTNVKHLSAGISGWKAAGEKTEAAN
jgi:rhodanese-related sulfurtransferase